MMFTAADNATDLLCWLLYYGMEGRIGATCGNWTVGYDTTLLHDNGVLGYRTGAS